VANIFDAHRASGVDVPLLPTSVVPNMRQRYPASSGFKLSACHQLLDQTQDSTARRLGTIAAP
jgi:hypothetical protein